MNVTVDPNVVIMHGVIILLVALIVIATKDINRLAQVTRVLVRTLF